MKDRFAVGTLFEDLFFSFVLLRKTPVPARLADDRVGYFTSQYKSLGISELAKRIYGFDTHQQLSREMLDADIRLITRVSFTDRNQVVYHIDPSVPKIFRSFLKQGVEGWNAAFQKAGYSGTVIRAVLPGDKDFPKDYDAGDVRYNSISWSLDLSRTFAIGPASVDPRSGEILNSDIVFTNGWLRSWFGEEAFGTVVSSAMGIDRPIQHFRSLRGM